MIFVGTPPRIDGRTIDYTNLIIQRGDLDPLPFSFLNEYSKITVSISL